MRANLRSIAAISHAAPAASAGLRAVEKEPAAGGIFALAQARSLTGNEKVGCTGEDGGEDALRIVRDEVPAPGQSSLFAENLEPRSDCGEAGDERS